LILSESKLRFLPPAPLQQIYELRLAEQEAGRAIAARVRPRAA